MMNIYEIRYKNARYLSDSVGGVGATAEKMDKSQPQISHLLADKPFKNIGPKIARQFESVFNKPKDWLDHPHPELWGGLEIQEEKAMYAVTLKSDTILTDEAIEFAKAFQALCPDQRAAINTTVQAFISTTKKQDKLA